MLQVTNRFWDLCWHMRTLGCRAFSAPVSCGAEELGSINAVVPHSYCLQALLAGVKCMGALRDILRAGGFSTVTAVTNGYCSRILLVTECIKGRRNLNIQINQRTMYHAQKTIPVIYIVPEG